MCGRYFSWTHRVRSRDRKKISSGFRGDSGAKSQWLDRRLTLNTAAFLDDYEDMQVSRTNIDAGGRVIVEVDNAV